MRHIQVTNPNRHPIRRIVATTINDCRAMLDYERIEHVELHMRVILFLWDVRGFLMFALSLVGPLIGLHIISTENK